MALVINDRVRERSDSSGTGPISLNGAYPGYTSFSTVLANGDKTYYAVVGVLSEDWEVGIGTYSNGGLNRDEVLSSSNEGEKVDFPEGSKDVFITLPASQVFHKGNFDPATKADTGDVITLEAKVLELDDDVRKIEDDVEGLGTAAYTDITTSDTDLTKGRVLKTGDFGVGDAIRLQPGSNLNNLLQPGEYRWNQDAAPLNIPPGADWAYLKVTSWTNSPASGVHQMCITSSAGIYIRRRSSAGVWSSWNVVYPISTTLAVNYLSGTVESAGIGTANDPPGTVNFSGGRVLTGLRTDGGGNWYSIYARGRTLTT